jgi:hypothetical protein
MRFIGIGPGLNEETAIEMAIQTFKITDPEQQNRVVAERRE